MILYNNDYETKTLVLKKKISEDEVKDLIQEKKKSAFSGLRKPKLKDIHVHSTKLYYESILMISGIYSADYYRKAVHPIKVDYNVREVVLGEGVFPIRTKSGLGKVISRKQGKNKVDLHLEEHVFIENEGTIYFDHHGNEIKFPFKLVSKILENYPKRILSDNQKDVKKPEITNDAAIGKLATKLKKPMYNEVKMLNEKLRINEISEIYIPIYEARLVDPKKKVGILRIDAVRKKIL